MSAWELLDARAAAWLAWSWRAGCASLVLLALLLLTRPLWRRRASAHLASWLALVPLVPLALPVALPAAVRLPSPGPPPLLVASHPRAAAPERPTSGPLHDETSSAPQPAAADAARAEPRPGPAPTPRALAVLLWWLVSASVLTRLVQRQLELRRYLRDATQDPTGASRRRFDELAREAVLRGRAVLRIAPGLSSPATCGVLRPVVLLPEHLVRTLDRAALDWVLRHELAHVRRRDVLVDGLLRVLRALWFFHPSAWVGAALATSARELACDEAALARSDPAAGPAAARALLGVLERAGRGAPALSVPFLSSDSLHRRRIMRLLDSRRPATRGMTRSAAAVLLGALALAIPSTAAAPSWSRADARADAAPSDELDATLQGALRYLVARQEADGRWRASTNPDEPGCGEFDDVGVTGLSLMALHQAPAGLDVPGRGAAVSRALAFLAAGQDLETGAFATVEQNLRAVPSHAIALRAWILAHEGSSDAGWRERAQLAVDFAQAARNPYMGWRYSYPPIGDNDANITGWMLLALAEASRVGLDVDPAALEGGAGLLDQLYDPETGRTGYDKRGNATSRLVAKKEDFPGEEVELPTAVAICARAALSQDALKTDAILAGAGLLLRRPPVWSVARGTIDSYYWAFGTQALASIGGVFAERWNEGLREALLPHAVRDEEGRAHWPAVDAWSCEGGEVHMTAMCALALEAARA